MLDLLPQGIQYIFSRWTALQLAVEGQWGGIETNDKYVWFIQTISDYIIKDGTRMDPIDIEEILDQIISEEFFVQLEDNSACQIANFISKLYLDLKKNNLTIFDQLKSIADKPNQRGQSTSQTTSTTCQDNLIENSDDQSVMVNNCSEDGLSETADHFSNLTTAANSDRDDDDGGGWIQY